MGVYYYHQPFHLISALFDQVRYDIIQHFISGNLGSARGLQTSRSLRFRSDADEGSVKGAGGYPPALCGFYASDDGKAELEYLRGCGNSFCCIRFFVIPTNPDTSYREHLFYSLNPKKNLLKLVSRNTRKRRFCHMGEGGVSSPRSAAGIPPTHSYIHKMFERWFSE